MVTLTAKQRLSQVRLTFTQHPSLGGAVWARRQDLVLRAEVRTDQDISTAEYTFMDPDQLRQDYDAAVEETLRNAFYLAVIEPLGERLKTEIVEAVTTGALRL